MNAEDDLFNKCHKCESRFVPAFETENGVWLRCNNAECSEFAYAIAPFALLAHVRNAQDHEKFDKMKRDYYERS